SSAGRRSCSSGSPTTRASAACGSAARGGPPAATTTTRGSTPASGWRASRFGGPPRSSCTDARKEDNAMAGLIVIAVLVVFALVAAARSIRVIPQARAGVVERLGRYSRTLEPGLTIITPFIDRVKPLVDLREQVVNFSPQSVITEDNVVVGIETVL